jgi:3'-phosphoadenosine 5'-phosphosulfate sulfotransferase (PAPS reductase)/FAD synthetase
MSATENINERLVSTAGSRAQQQKHEKTLPSLSTAVARALVARTGRSADPYSIEVQRLAQRAFEPEGNKHMVDSVASNHQLNPELLRATQQEIAAAMEKHSRVLLQSSFGKDSLACFYLLRPWWDRLTVMWSSRGDAYPEVREMFERIRPMVLNVAEVSGNAKAHADMGIYPVDLVPVRKTWFGRTVEPSNDPFVLAYRYDCCLENFWKPMAQATEAGGFDLVVRGQRDSESKRAPYSSGMVDPGGRTYLLPLQHWSKQDVFAYLRAEGVEIPRQYAYGLASLDCVGCTAYLDENGGKLRYLREFHPDAAVEYEVRLRLIQGAQEREARLMRVALGEADPVGEEGCGD